MSKLRKKKARWKPIPQKKKESRSNETNELKVRKRSSTTDDNERGSVPLTQMNGRSSSPQPQWPSTQLLTISYQLKENFSFTINGSMMNPPKRLTVSLETGSKNFDENVVCQLAAKYDKNILYVKNGKIQKEEGLDVPTTAGELLEGSNFAIVFGCKDDYHVDIYNGNSHIKQVDLDNSIREIRYISVDGNVERIGTLSYDFGDGLRGDQIYDLPEWYRPKLANVNSIVFLVPRVLQPQNVITLSGSLVPNPNSFKISLVTEQSDTNNSYIACQLDANFDENSYQLNSVVNGELTAYDLLVGSEFNISFTCRSGNGENFFDIFSNNSLLDQVPTGHDYSDIRYIVLEGSIDLVKSLQFEL